jgi:RHS repeat-associated protein
MPHTPLPQSHTVLLATDEKNSILAEVAGGQPNSVAFSAYGQQSSQQEVATNLGFNGGLREAHRGWYLLGNGYRAYNPTLMRFHSPDSWSPFNGGGLNAYMYCGGDPVNFSDPTGHVRWLPSWKSIKNFFSRKDSTYSPLTNSPSSVSVDSTAGNASVLPLPPKQSQTHVLVSLPSELKQSNAPYRHPPVFRTPRERQVTAPFLHSSDLSPMNAQVPTTVNSTPASAGSSLLGPPINRAVKPTNPVNWNVPRHYQERAHLNPAKRPLPLTPEDRALGFSTDLEGDVRVDLEVFSTKVRNGK